MSAKPALRLVVSNPDQSDREFTPELCRSIAESVADAVGIACARLGRRAIIEDIVTHLMDQRGISDLNTLGRITSWAGAIILQREVAAIEAHRRPKLPRRSRSRAPRPVQLCLPFLEAGRPAA